jgi:hypothetical protein
MTSPTHTRLDSSRIVEPAIQAITTEEELNEVLIGIAEAMEPPALFPKAIVEFTHTVIAAMAKGELDDVRYDELRESPLSRLLHAASGYAKAAVCPILVTYAGYVYDAGSGLANANRALIQLLGLEKIGFQHVKLDGGPLVLGSTAAFENQFGYRVAVPTSDWVVSWIPHVCGL